MITIIDSGGANIASIQFALQRLNVSALLTQDPDVIRKSTHIILPGVGSADRTMQRLKNNSLIALIPTLTQPVLGICLGMQLLFDFSEEGNVECLKIITGKVTELSRKKGLSMPHMGWNTLNITKNDTLMKHVSNQAFVYFVHGFKVPLGKYTLACTQYGDAFTAALQYQNFYGVQFHPERSSDVGQLILKNFLEL